MTVRIMKLAVILLLVACLQLSARGLTQTVTISVKDAPLITVLKAIEKQTDFVFFVNSKELKRAKSVSITANNLPLQQVLDMCFKDQPLTYSITGKWINIIPRIEKVEKDINTNSLPPLHQIIDVKGRIVDENGQPVSGATIAVQGTNNSTSTDANGVFQLADVDEKATLIVTHVQYESSILFLNGRKYINTTLHTKISPLDEMQVIAYGTTTRRFNTGNVSTIKSSVIQQQPVSNPLLALQGRVPGLFIEQANGVPGSGVKVRIQGQNSLRNGSDPLYVIDGVPWISSMPTSLSGIQGTSGNQINGSVSGNGNPMSYINPADIESIEILKDADATSIYGSRAAAGAILITTKKGKAGKTKVDLNVQTGIGQVSHYLDLLNTPQYLEVRKEAKANDGASIGATDYDINGVWDTTQYTDWQKLLIGGTAHYTDGQISVSGGSGTTTFLIGAGFHKETTVFPGNLQDKKSSLHFNLNHASNSQRFRLLLDAKYLIDDNNLILTDLTDKAINLPPDAPAIFKEDGSLNWAPDPLGKTTWTNPLAYLLQSYYSHVNNLIANSVISYSILPGLDLKSNFGYTNLLRKEVAPTPIGFNPPENQISANRMSGFSNLVNTSWVAEPQVSYKRKYKSLQVDALIGTTFLVSELNQDQIFASDFTSDELLKDIRSAGTIRAGTTIVSQYKYNALFGRLNLNFKEKYILNFSGRRDGSSRFGSENLFSNFWSVGSAWIFTSESFFKNHFRVLNFGKIRVSYGTTGNDQIGDYGFMSLYTSQSRTVPYQGITGLRTTGFPNPYLQWEKVNKLQGGIDLGFWSNKVMVSLNYYLNRSSNQLQPYVLPLMTGSNSLTFNFPATIQNSGLELAINSQIIETKSFSWSTSVNLTVPKNKLVKYENLEKSTFATTYIIGQPFTITKLYKSLGVDQTTGLFIFLDSQRNVTSTPSASNIDRVVFYNNSPAFFGGFQNSFRFKGFTLDFLFQYVKQKATDYTLGNNPGSFSSDITFGVIKGNQPTSVLNRWQKPGDNSLVQKYSSSYPTSVNTPYLRARFSDLILSDASYLRLKNVSISWDLPKKWINRIKTQSARIYLLGQNLFTRTNYLGLDPESKSNSSLPPLRIITGGIQFSF